MLLLSDEHTQSGGSNPWCPAPDLWWCEDWEVKCITSGESLPCSGPVLDTAAAAVTGPAPPLETAAGAWPLATLCPTVGKETHTAHPAISGALTSGHWTRGHVCQETASQQFASQRTEELGDSSHCECYLKHYSLRSEFYLAAVSWLTDSNSSLFAADTIVILVERVRVIPALTVWQCSFSSAYWRSEIIGVKSSRSSLEELEIHYSN